MLLMRPRMYFDIDDRLRWAMRLEAADRNIPSVAQLTRILIEEVLQARLAEVDRRIAKGELPSQGKSPRGRKRRPADIHKPWLKGTLEATAKGRRSAASSTQHSGRTHQPSGVGE